MLIGGISPYSKVTLLRVENYFENLWCFKLEFFSKIFVTNFAIKVYTKWSKFFTMLKVVNSTVSKSNTFHGNYPITTFGVVFLPPFWSHSATLPPPSLTQNARQRGYYAMSQFHHHLTTLSPAQNTSQRGY